VETQVRKPECRNDPDSVCRRIYRREQYREACSRATFISRAFNQDLGAYLVDHAFDKVEAQTNAGGVVGFGTIVG
jgi:hypothetical protein